MIKTTIRDCRIIPLQTITRPEGMLTVVEKLPFQIKRSYYIYDVPEAGERGHHAHKTLKQLIVAIKGSFAVHLKDGCDERVIALQEPSEGLLIVPGLWRELYGFSRDAVCLVYVSAVYDENDYIRNYEQFLKYKELCTR